MVKIVKTASFRQTQKNEKCTKFWNNQSNPVFPWILNSRAQQPKKQVMLKNNAGKHFHE